MKGSIITRTLKSGEKRYCVMYRDGTGKQHGKVFEKRKTADEFLVRICGQVHDGTYVDVRGIEMNGLFDKWEEWLTLQTQMGLIKFSTAKVYRTIVGRFFRPMFGLYMSNELSSDTVGEWQRDLAKQVGTGAMKPKTYNNVVTLLKGILKWARRSDQRFLRHDPAEYLERLPKPKVEREILEPAELKALMDAAASSPVDEIVIKTFAFSGCRRGEIFGLQWSDLQRNPDGSGRLYIKRAIVFGKVTTPKTAAGVRVVDIPKGLVDELLTYKSLSPANEEDWMFASESGGYRDPDNWYKRHFLPIVKRAGLRQIGLHCLRHSYVSLLIDQGENLKYISRQVGHSSIQLTADIYGHILKETSATAMKRLDERLRTEPSSQKLTEATGTAPNTVEEPGSKGRRKLLENNRKSKHHRTGSKAVEMTFSGS